MIASARRPADVQRLTREGLEAVRLDLDDTASLEQAVDRTLALGDGRLYALFNNGACGQPGAVEALSRAVLRTQLETNLLGWHDLTRRVTPRRRIPRAPAATRLHGASHSPSIGYPGATAIPYNPAVMARRDEATATA